MNSRNMKVGTGSKEQDLIGDDIAILRTSSREHDRKDVNDDGALLMIGGGGRLAVSKKDGESVRHVTRRASDITVMSKQRRHRLSYLRFHIFVEDQSQVSNGLN